MEGSHEPIGRPQSGPERMTRLRGTAGQTARKLNELLFGVRQDDAKDDDQAPALRGARKQRAGRQRRQ